MRGFRACDDGTTMLRVRSSFELKEEPASRLNFAVKSNRGRAWFLLFFLSLSPQVYLLPEGGSEKSQVGYIHKFKIAPRRCGKVNELPLVLDLLI